MSVTKQFESLASAIWAQSADSLDDSLECELIAACQSAPRDVVRLIVTLHQSRKWRPLRAALKSLTKIGFQIPVLDVAAAHAAIRCEDSVDLERALTRLRARDFTPEAGQDEIMGMQLSSLIGADIVEALYQKNRPTVGALVSLALAINPKLLDADPALRLQHAMRFEPLSPRQGRLPPRRLLVVGRARILGTASRPIELWARIAAAAKRVGWTATTEEIEGNAANEFLTQVLAAIDRDNPDVVIIDNFGLLDDMSVSDRQRSAFAVARSKHPRMRIVALYTDPWSDGDSHIIAAAAPHADLIWCPIPALPLWNNPVFKGKLLWSPFPMGVDPSAAQMSSDIKNSYAEVGFVGAVNWYNWHRGVWIDRLWQSGHRVQIVLSDHQDDGLDPLHSFGQYLGRLAQFGSVLNFTRRGNGVSTMTGRTFEVLSTGRLLIQEATAGLDVYLTPGKECLVFHNWQELEDLLAVWENDPAQLQTIAASGHRRFVEAFSDRATISTLAVRLGLDLG